MGFVSDRDSIYDQIDVCVVPSRFAEPFGLVAVEAASYGLPVVATRRGGLGELIIDRQTGYIVDPESPAQIAEILREISASSERRNQMGRMARSHVTQKFSMNSMTDGIEAVLTSMIEKRALGNPVFEGPGNA
jgi:glycosyltransferase involved in cell wall biosynthesis